MLRLLYHPGSWAPRNLAPPRARVALIVVKLCKSRFTAICGPQIARQNALAGCEIFRDRDDWEALEVDPPMDDETFVFGSLRLIPAQRMLPEDRKPLHLGSRALDILITLARYCRRREGAASSRRRAPHGAWRRPRGQSPHRQTPATRSAAVGRADQRARSRAGRRGHPGHARTGARRHDDGHRYP